jgi:putative nucleotidyltransferase with HDIG domain
MKTNRIEQIEEYVKAVLPVNSVHDYEHINRVRNWALVIAHEEIYEKPDLVEAVALLHDIGYSYVDEADHGQIGAEKAREYLLENGNFNEKEINEIVNAIRHHSSNRGGEGILLDILRDADMLDGLGAFGILRCIKPMASDPDYNPKNIKGETWGMGVKDFNERMDSDKGAGEYIVDHLNFQISWYGNLATDTARRFAKPLVAFLKKYVLQLESEVNLPQKHIHK